MIDAAILQAIADFYATGASIVLPRSRSNTELLQVIAAATTGMVQHSLSDTTLLQATAAGLAANPPVSVPSDAPIRPAQAFIDNIAKFTASDAVTLASGTVTYLDPALVARNSDFQNFANSATTFNFSGKAITNTDAILSACTNHNNVHINLSGGTTVPPTKQGGALHFDCDDGGGGFEPATLTFISDSIEIATQDDGEIPLAESFFDGTNIKVGVSDTPTPSAIASRVAAIFNSDISAYGTATPSGSVVTLAIVAAKTPIGLTGTGAVTAPGGNADIKTIADNGGSATTN